MDREVVLWNIKKKRKHAIFCNLDKIGMYVFKQIKFKEKRKLPVDFTYL